MSNRQHEKISYHVATDTREIIIDMSEFYGRSHFKICNASAKNLQDVVSAHEESIFLPSFIS